MIFFLYRMKDVTTYVTLFAAGHVLTLLSGVLLEISISAYIIDAIIGFSMVYAVYNSNIPSDRALPSSAQLIKSTILAVVIAGILLVTVVMPAEYGIDPTGIGNAIGLKRMGEIKMLLAEEAAADAAGNAQPVEALVEVVEQPPSPEATPTSAVATQQHEVTFTLAPMEGTEVKVTMAEGAKVNYVWETDGGPANFDEHGDSQVLNISYHEYATGAEQRSEGVLEAAFDGNHGWFWRNRTETPLSITLRINGEYTDMIRY